MKYGIGTTYAAGFKRREVAMSTQKVGDWYTHRDKLSEGMVFRDCSGSFVKLDRTVPGDGSKWYVANWHDGWAYYDSTIEPGDLCGEPLDSAALARCKGGAK